MEDLIRQRLIRFLVGLLVPRSEREFFLGDLNEMFAENVRQTDGNRRSRFREALGAVQLIIESRRLAPKRQLRMRDNPVYEFARDVRFGLRMMGRSPGFTAVAILTLALGIGANTATYSVADAILFEPLPFYEPDRLMRASLVVPVSEHGPATPQEIVWSWPKYNVFKETQRVFSASAAHSPISATLVGGNEPERVAGERIESAYLGILGIAPVLGRGFTPEDDLPGASAKILLSHAFWRRRWGADPSVVGRTMSTSTRTYTVIGVLPEGFKGLSGKAEFFISCGQLSEARRATIWSHSFFVVARLKDNATPAEARTEMALVATRIDETFTTTNMFDSDSHFPPRYPPLPAHRATPKPHKARSRCLDTLLPGTHTWQG